MTSEDNVILYKKVVKRIKNETGQLQRKLVWNTVPPDVLIHAIMFDKYIYVLIMVLAFISGMAEETLNL